MALSKHNVPTSLQATPIACAPNANISDSGCGNTGWGNSGKGNNGTGNSGVTNTGSGNSGTSNIGNGNSGTGNVGNGNSGSCNTGNGNSGTGNTGAGNSGGSVCAPVKVVTTTTVGVAPPASTVPSATLPLTGRNSEAPLTLAIGLMLAGGATVTIANRRRHAMATVTGEMVPLSTAVGLLLTGRAKAGS